MAGYYILKNESAGVVLSRHRTLEAAEAARGRHLKSVRRANGPAAFLQYSIEEPTKWAVVCGKDVFIAVGRMWRAADIVDCPPLIQEEIAAEIVDRGRKRGEYRATNGEMYRW